MTRQFRFLFVLIVQKTTYENLKSLKIFKSALFRQKCVFAPKTTHFKPKLACFERGV